MVAQGLEFHNVDHLDAVPGMSGFRLERFPEQFRKKLGVPENRNGRFRAGRAHGCEIRFVTEARYFDIALTAVEADIDVVIYCGDMMHSKHRLSQGSLTVLHIEYPEIYRMVELSKLPARRFSPNVWRLQFGMNGAVYFHYLDTFGEEHRPPISGEKPDTTWAAYGSSITCGSVTTLYSNAYIEQAALRLKVDVMNKGLSGSCFLEPFVADYLAGLSVDMMTLELGVNMIHLFGEKEFKERVEYLLHKVRESSPARRIYVIDMYPNKGWIMKNHEERYYIYSRKFNEITGTVMKELEDDRMVYIRGDEILQDLTCLSTDLLHPSDYGHIIMGENLASWIKRREESGTL